MSVAKGSRPALRNVNRPTDWTICLLHFRCHCHLAASPAELAPSNPRAVCHDPHARAAISLQYHGDAGNCKWKLDFTERSAEVFQSQVTLKCRMVNCTFMSFEGKNTKTQSTAVGDINNQDAVRPAAGMSVGALVIWGGVFLPETPGAYSRVQYLLCTSGVVVVRNTWQSHWHPVHVLLAMSSRILLLTSTTIWNVIFTTITTNKVYTQRFQLKFCVPRRMKQSHKKMRPSGLPHRLHHHRFLLFPRLESENSSSAKIISTT